MVRHRAPIKLGDNNTFSTIDIFIQYYMHNNDDLQFFLKKMAGEHKKILDPGQRLM
jgi:hypothetical protein